MVGLQPPGFSGLRLRPALRTSNLSEKRAYILTDNPKQSKALPTLSSRPDGRQAYLGILGLAQMRRAFRDDHFRSRPHMCRAEVPGLGLPCESPVR
jgi:hypothetical protein